MRALKFAIKDKPTRNCLYYIVGAASALVLWAFNQDHWALGMAIFAICWSWSPTVFFDEHK